MVLTDPDLPPGIKPPRLGPEPPSGIDPARYRGLREAFEALPRRSRVAVALRLPPPGHAPMTLQQIGTVLDLGTERVRQLETHALWTLTRAWLEDGGKGLSRRDWTAALAPIIGAALDRHPLD